MYFSLFVLHVFLHFQSLERTMILYSGIFRYYFIDISTVDSKQIQSEWKKFRIRLDSRFRSIRTTLVAFLLWKIEEPRETNCNFVLHIMYCGSIWIMLCATLHANLKIIYITTRVSKPITWYHPLVAPQDQQSTRARTLFVSLVINCGTSWWTL